MREVRVSPDRNSIAIRSDNAAENWNAWAVMHAVNGGYWASTDEVNDWEPLTVPVPVEPEPTP